MKYYNMIFDDEEYKKLKSEAALSSMSIIKFVKVAIEEKIANQQKEREQE